MITASGDQEKLNALEAGARTKCMTNGASCCSLLIVCAEKLLPHGRLVTSVVAPSVLGFGLLGLARPELLALTLA
jgi:hypothetical protein